MSEDHVINDDARGWGYGLATWVLASSTAHSDVVLDFDPGVRWVAEVIDRAYLSGTGPSTALPWKRRPQAAALLETSRTPAGASTRW
jgi:hypothetical protein